MESIIHTKTFAQPPVNRREILRYMRCGDESEHAFDKLLADCLAELLPQLVYKVCWRAATLRTAVRENPAKTAAASARIAADKNAPSACDLIQANTQPSAETLLDLGFLQTDSQGLCRNLQGCDKVILFAATVGLVPDRLIAKYGRLSPTKALCMQAIGAERIESLCDAFCDELAADYAAEGYQTRPRFSPGYGDFPLDAQKAFFRALDCPRKIGLSLNDSLLMSPSKSVTALIGLLPRTSQISGTEAKTHANCTACGKTDCLFRQP